jgi:hypothetical protein
MRCEPSEQQDSSERFGFAAAMERVRTSGEHEIALIGCQQNSRTLGAACGPSNKSRAMAATDSTRAVINLLVAQDNSHHWEYQDDRKYHRCDISGLETMARLAGMLR